MAVNKTCMLAVVVLAVSLMQLAPPAMGATRHLFQDPTSPPASPAADAGAGALPGAGGLVGNTTANETAIQQCYALLESYNITLVNATTNETVTPAVGCCIRGGVYVQGEPDSIHLAARPCRVMASRCAVWCCWVAALPS
jgi:hypothetical protein